MGVYRTLLKKDAFITTQYPDANTGVDEILSLGSETISDGTRVVQRILVEPDLDSINSFIASNAITDYKAILKINNAVASAIPESLVVNAFPIKTTNDLKWVNGVGKLNDVPKDVSGVSWKTITGIENDTWAIVSGSEYNFPEESTGSIDVVVGGGSWLTGSAFATSQSFELGDSLDISLDVTNFISASISGSLFNNGLLLKLDDGVENSTRNYKLDFFSKETNTVFSPQLHILWDNQQYETGSLLALDTSDIVVTSTNLQPVYRPVNNVRLNLHVRPKYPARKFTTSSVYLDKYYLPSDALWSIEDYYTGEVIIDFQDPYTRVNCDVKSPYVNLDLRLLGLERYYKVVVKTVIDGSTVVRELEPFKISLYGSNS